jgi:acyl-coenzyme A thioesterase PaaI-like protein
MIPFSLKATAVLRTFGFLKIPLLFFIRPSVVELDDRRCVIKVPFIRRNKNHLGSMYFGVLCAAADLAGGLQAYWEIRKSKRNVALIFKDFKAEFLKRVEGDVFMSSDQGEAIKKLVERAIATGERVEMPVPVIATVPTQFGTEPVARFTLTLSLKLKEKKG